MRASKEVKSILLAGVGGQGVLRASDVLCLVVMEVGMDVKKSEVHGMAQRGGCVTSHVRYGKKVYSPIAKKGDVDILVSFEKLEALRYLDFLKPHCAIIINEKELYPPSVNLGDAHYPDNIIEIIKNSFKFVKIVNAGDIALEAGDIRAENTALLGVLSQYLKIDLSLWEKVIHTSFPEKAIAANLKAFHMGRAA
ncbi:MAG TPA: indolepyruvate oxidoreductase subunit beta [Syntrophaceae bacterium]|jgi:indolepyruvate ferredoxin oxidoreductase beta subunit|nr:indolepyruvate oxidoreductase subunit beta [Syntrophaceae bacterium]